jgi:indoleacetamide hydrolase
VTLSVQELIERIASRDTKTLFEDCARTQIAPTTLAKARGALREKIQQVYRNLFSAHHIVAIAFPTSPIVAPLINPNGDRRDAQIDLNGRRVNLGQTMFRNTRVTGALGAPGLSLPAGLTRQGLPVGLELDGLNGADAELLAVGIRVEQVLGALPAPDI